MESTTSVFCRITSSSFVVELEASATRVFSASRTRARSPTTRAASDICLWLSVRAEEIRHLCRGIGLSHEAEGSSLPPVDVDHTAEDDISGPDTDSQWSSEDEVKQRDAWVRYSIEWRGHFGEIVSRRVVIEEDTHQPSAENCPLVINCPLVKAGPPSNAFLCSRPKAKRK